MQPTKQRILCVEDNEDTCLMLSFLLGQAGYEVRQADSFAEGLRLTKSERFDLYILDNRFADGTGLELCGRIRELHPATPIIFLSGLAHESDRQRGLKAGAQAYLIKPDGISKLVETIRRLAGNNDRVPNSTPTASASARH